MSLLSELLSKIKHQKPKRDVPPGLKTTIKAFKKKEPARMRLAILSVSLVTVLSLGFVTVYLLNVSRKETTLQDVQKAEEPFTVGLVSKATVETNIVEAVAKDQKAETNIVEAVAKDKEAKVKSTLKKATKREVLKKPLPSKPQKALKDTSQEVTKAEKPKRDPSEKDLYLYMAWDYESKRDYPNAIESYKKVLAVEPLNYKVMNNIAALFIRLNSFEEANFYVQKALKIKSSYVPALINAGIIFAKSGKNHDAENYLLRALSYEPDNRYALFNIGLLYEKEGDYEKAFGYYSKLKLLGDERGSAGLERINRGSMGK